jgi:hypothetical protein
VLFLARHHYISHQTAHKKQKNNKIRQKAKKELDFFARNNHHWSGDKDFSAHNSTELAR